MVYILYGTHRFGTFLLLLPDEVQALIVCHLGLFLDVAKAIYIPDHSLYHFQLLLFLFNEVLFLAVVALGSGH